MDKIPESWGKVAFQTPFEIVKELAIAVQQFYEENKSEFNQSSPLHIVAYSGSLLLCKHIIDNFGRFCHNKNPTNHSGVTPLYVAAEKGHFDICKLIVENVENKNPPRNDGVTPLNMAHFKIVKLILAWKFFS